MQMISCLADWSIKMQTIINHPTPKMPFQLLDFEVKKLYSKPFSPTDIVGVNAYCDFIREYIESCGWAPEEYIERINRFDHLN
jgi:hypothetical protein